MGLTLIERYIFKKALIAVLAAGGGLVAVIWVVRAVQQVDVLLQKGQGIFTYLNMTTLGVPTLTVAVAPLALLIGLIQTINSLNSDSELVVIHASGASRLSLLKPFILLSILVTLFVWVLQLWLAPVSMQTLRTYVTKVRADLVTIVVREGVFQQVGKGLTFHLAARAPGGVLKGILIVDDRDEKQTFSYLAREGAVSKIDEKSYLVLQEGQIQRRSNSDGLLSIVKFNSYAFNLSDFSGGKQSKNFSQMEIDTMDLIFPDRESALYKRDQGRFLAELHTRLTGGFYPFMVGLVLLTFVGNPNSNRQGQFIVVTTACIVVFILRGLSIYGEGALRNTPMMVYLVWSVPLLSIAVSTFLLATDRSAFPPELLNKVETQLNRISQRLQPVRTMLFGKSVRLGATS